MIVDLGSVGKVLRPWPDRDDIYDAEVAVVDSGFVVSGTVTGRREMN